VGYEKSNRVLGVISATEKGTEVRNISGKILVNASTTGTRTLTSGESILIGQDNIAKVFKTQSFPRGTGGAAVSSGGHLAAQAAILALFGAGATWTYFKGFKSNSKF
jgi:hypothetical protein